MSKQEFPVKEYALLSSDLVVSIQDYVYSYITTFVEKMKANNTMVLVTHSHLCLDLRLPTYRDNYLNPQSSPEEKNNALDKLFLLACSIHISGRLRPASGEERDFNQEILNEIYNALLTL